MANYQVWSNGVAQGPYPAHQLLQSGLNADTMVWTEGLPQWTPARLVPELAAMLNVPASSPSTMFTQHGPPAGYSVRPAGKPGVALKWCSFSSMIVALLCFLGPVFNITCAGQTLMRVSGPQLAFGTEAEVKNPMDGSPTGRKEAIPAQPMALLALICIALGVAAVFLPNKIGPGALVGCALVAVIAMFILKSKIDADAGGKVQAESKSAFGDPSAGGSASGSGSSAFNLTGGVNPIRVEYGIGFYGPVVLGAAAMVLGVLWLMKKPAGPAPGG